MSPSVKTPVAASCPPRLLRRRAKWQYHCQTDRRRNLPARRSFGSLAALRPARKIPNSTTTPTCRYLLEFMKLPKVSTTAARQCKPRNTVRMKVRRLCVMRRAMMCDSHSATLVPTTAKHEHRGSWRQGGPGTSSPSGATKYERQAAEEHAQASRTAY